MYAHCKGHWYLSCPEEVLHCLQGALVSSGHRMAQHARYISPDAEGAAQCNFSGSRSWTRTYLQLSGDPGILHMYT